MKKKLLRRFSEGLELRQVDGEDPVVSGYVVKYDDVADFGDGYTERIAPGAYNLEKRIHLDVQHDRSKLISAYPAEMQFRDDSTGLYVEANIIETRDGLDAIMLVERRALVGFSTEFWTISDEYDKRARTVTEADLFGVGLVSYPAYDQSQAMLRDRISAYYEASGDDWAPEYREIEMRSKHLCFSQRAFNQFTETQEPTPPQPQERSRSYLFFG